MLRKTLLPEDIVAIVDTREQHPLDLAPLRVEKGTLVTADYSVKGLTDHVAIERKSLSDLLGVIGNGRERFDKEIKRMLGYPVRALVVESTWEACEAGLWLTQGRCQVRPQAVIGSLLGWMAHGIPVLMVGTHEQAGRYVSRILFTAARRRWEEMNELRAIVGEKRKNNAE